MVQKKSLTGNSKYGMIRRVLRKRYGKETEGKITALAQKQYLDCVQLCTEASEGEWKHLEGTILPTVAVYRALQEIDPENALSSTHAMMMQLCETGGAAVGALLRLPGMKGMFMRLLPKMALTMFGTGCGFAYEHYEASATMLKMDMTGCPYCRYTQKLGCPELMKVFCDSDFATYGNLPGIRFQRTQTLGTGGSCCDFRFMRES